MLLDPYSQKPIQPLINKPQLNWMGGKKWLAKFFITRINKYDYSMYVEPYSGGARIYFEKNPHFMEILNDKNACVSNFFFCCKEWPLEMEQQQEFLIKDENEFHIMYELFTTHFKPISKQIQDARLEWELHLHNDEEAKTFLIHRAIQFYFFRNMVFRGSESANTMTYFENDPPSETNRMRYRIYRPLAWLGERMRRTQIFNKDFAEVMKRALAYKNHRIIFYLDPPYPGTQEYQIKMLWPRYIELNEILKTITEKDYFFLSMPNKKSIRKLFSWCHILKHPTYYTTGGNGQRKRVYELIITPPWKPKLKEGGV
jgi:DNA adenine methylase